MAYPVNNSVKPAMLLAKLVRMCKCNRLVRELADALQLTPQTVYLWDKTDRSLLTYRAAKLRLFEISRVVTPSLAEIAHCAAKYLDHVEVAERGE